MRKDTRLSPGGGVEVHLQDKAHVRKDTRLSPGGVEVHLQDKAHVRKDTKLSPGGGGGTPAGQAQCTQQSDDSMLS